MVQKKKSTVWPIDDHTRVKHEILKEYLKAWIPIIGRTSNTSIFLDGFAGPGIYENNELGSPIIALKTAQDHSDVAAIKNMKFIFIEKDKERYDILKETVEETCKDLPNIKYDIMLDGFVEKLSSMLDDIKEKNELPPTFAFIDPFGYSEIPFELIKKFMQNSKCELLLTFMTQHMMRFLTTTPEDTINKLYGTTSWHEATKIENVEKKINFLITLYMDQLKKSNVKFTRSFRMINSHGNAVYHLIFATKHWRGMNEMKKSMIKIDKSESYKFSDMVGLDQTSIVDYTDNSSSLDSASEHILNKFSSKTASLSEIRDYVVGDTPHIFNKKILKHMEENGKINNVVGRTRAKTYPNGCTITFS